MKLSEILNKKVEMPFCYDCDKGLNKPYNDVKTFHETFNHPISDKPKVLDEERTLARSDWMSEEIQEFIEAENVADQTDAMIDLIYFALGTLVEMGVKPQACFEIVQEANMAKLFPDGKPHYNYQTKTIKPEGWEDPYPKLKKEIERQGSN